MYINQIKKIPSQGYYVSEIYDAGASSKWNDILWVSGNPYGKAYPNYDGIETTFGGIDMSSTIYLVHFDESITGANYEIGDYSGDNQINFTAKNGASSSSDDPCWTTRTET